MTAAARPHARALRLPRTVAACLFDLDGVLTDTAALHAEAWKQMFDEFLRGREASYVPFDLRGDYALYVDGKERSDGVRGFLVARGIRIPEGAPGDPVSADTVHGLGNRKNALVLRLIRERGVVPFADARRFVEAVRAAGLATAVVSSSTNCRDVLQASALADLFDERVDALTAAERGLRGKPHPDMFLEAARALGVRPDAAAVFEDALVGVEAGRDGGFALVVGVARGVSPALLRAHGADLVVRELTELLEPV